MLKFDIPTHMPLRELVYEELRTSILTGKIKPGTRLMEVDLAEDMGVSRTPIREAIRKLEKEGLVLIEPRRGAYASPISLKDIVDILEVRSNLEGLAASYAAERMNDAQKKELFELSRRFHQAVIDGNAAGMISNDTKFHHLIVEASGNKHLIQVVEQLQELVLRFRYIYFTDFKRAEEMIPEHQQIYEQIVSGNGSKARWEAYNHIDRLKDMIIKEELFAE